MRSTLWAIWLLVPDPFSKPSVRSFNALKHREHRLALDSKVGPADLIDDLCTCVISKRVINRRHEVAGMHWIVTGVCCNRVAADVDLPADGNKAYARFHQPARDQTTSSEFCVAVALDRLRFFVLDRKCTPCSRRDCSTPQ